MNVIFGAGGFAREVGWLMDDLARQGEMASQVDAFVASDDAPSIGQNIHGTPIVAESDFFARHYRTRLNAYLAVGSPQLKERLHEKCLTALAAVNFPALVHPSVQHDHRSGAIDIGAGAIICAGTTLTTDVKIGDFAHVNLNCTIGHDAMIGAFCTLSPGVHVSGGVALGRGCFVGSGAVFLENVHVHDATIIGAGATVTRTLDQSGTYVGIPARLRS